MELSRSGFTVDSDGTRIVGELLEAPGARALVVLVHGIPLHAPDPSDGGYPLLAARVAERGYGVLHFNMRGTGQSGGDFHIAGWYRDIESVMEFVRTGLIVGFDTMYMAGFSAGAALSIRYAAEHGGVDGLACFAAPASFTTLFPEDNLFTLIELAREIGIIRHFDFPPSPADFYNEFRSNSAIDFIERVSPIPLLLVHGGDDRMVPGKDAHDLYDAAGEPKELAILPAGAHQLRHDERALQALFGWLVRLGA